MPLSMRPSRSTCSGARSRTSSPARTPRRWQRSHGSDPTRRWGPANRQLTLGWGSHLAGAVLKRAGRAVEAEALAAHPGGIALGEAAITGAGGLPNYRRLIHAAVLDKFDCNPLFLLRLRERTSARTLSAATLNSLTLAHSHGLTGIVFTPMGAGIGGMRREKCADVMLAAIEEFHAAHEGTPVQDIVVAA